MTPLSTRSQTELQDSDYQRQFSKLNKWVAGRPDSATAQIALAHLYLEYGDFARGPGPAESLSDEQRKLQHERIVLAKKTLLQAATLPERDPFWYYVMQWIAGSEGWDKGHARELLDQSIAFEPGFYHSYRLYATYLLPTQHGQPGDLHAFAEEVAANHPEPAGSILYFQIMSSLACYQADFVSQLQNADWEKEYGVSDLNGTRFAEMAYVFNDKAVAHEAFSHVYEYNPTVWPDKQTILEAQIWTNMPDMPNMPDGP